MSMMGMFMYMVIDMAIATSVIYSMSFVIDSSTWGEFAFRTVPIALLFGNIRWDMESILWDELVDSLIRANAACQD